MSKRFSKSIAVLLVVLLALTILTSCQEAEKTSGTGKEAGSKTTEKEEQPEDEEATEATKVKASDYVPNVNKDKILTLTWGTWPKPPQFQGNPFTQGGIGEADNWVMEPLVLFVRSTDKLYNYLANEIEHRGNQTNITLRNDVTWNDGQKFTADDIIAAWYMNPRRICNYLSKVEKTGDYTVTLTWLDPAPNDELRDLMIAQDGIMNVPYHVFKKYADKAKAIRVAAKDATQEELAVQRVAFGKKYTKDEQKQLDTLWQDMMKMTYPKPVGTGPYVVDTVTASDLVLTKRKDYWAAERVYFEKIHHIMATPDAMIAMMRNGTTDVYNGSLPKDLAESVLTSNKDMVFYPMLDPASHVLYFNQTHKPFDDVNVRRALVYALNRTAIREGANYYGKEFPISMVGIPPSSITTYVSQEMQDRLTKYEYNADTATKILQDNGWKKNGEGVWQDKNGKTYNFTIGVNAGWQPAGVVDTAASIAAEQLTSFGFPTQVKAVDNSVWWNNAAVEHQYDMAIEWGDITWGFMYPWDPLNNTFTGGPADLMGLKRNKTDNRVELKVKGPDGIEINPVAMLERLPVVADESERQKIIDTLVWICNEYAFGANLYQNTTGVWYNRGHVTGLPMENEIDKFKQFMPIGRTPEEIEQVAEMNLGFARRHVVFWGILKPR